MARFRVQRNGQGRPKSGRAGSALQGAKMKIKCWLFIGGVVLAWFIVGAVLEKMARESEDDELYQKEDSLGIGA